MENISESVRLRTAADAIERSDSARRAASHPGGGFVLFMQPPAVVIRHNVPSSRGRAGIRMLGLKSAICGLAAVGLLAVSAPAANAETIDELVARSTTFTVEDPVLLGLLHQGYGYLDVAMVDLAWKRTCWWFGGAHGASDIAINEAKSELAGLRFTPAEADAIIGIALRVHNNQPGPVQCP